ncbi:putative reverse transcriptase domain, reverse transcriptase zinc-binding domain protein [Tanacetum coccineum]
MLGGGEPQKFILKSTDGDGSVSPLMASPLKRSVTFESLADGNESHVVASVVDSHNETHVTIPDVKCTFASLLKLERTTMKINFCSLRNEEQVVNSDVVILKHAKDKVMCRYENTLVGYFVGKSIAFHLVQNYVNNTWSKFGLQKVMRTDNGVFLFKFLSSTGVDQVIKVLVWVKLHGVPVLAYSDIGLSLIATQIGKPIMLDAFTSLMCVDSWGRISFARALIEVSADTILKNDVVMAIPNDDGNGHTMEVIRVEYEWKPPHCVACKCFGHDPNTCPKRVKEATPKDTNRDPTFVEENEDEFVQVKSRKKKKKKMDKVVELTFLNAILTFNIARFLNREKEMVKLLKKLLALRKVRLMIMVMQAQDSLWEKFKANKEASNSKSKFTSLDCDDDSNDDKEVCMLDGMIGGDFIDGLEDDLDCYDGYGTHVYDLTPQEQAFCDQYDIRLNSRGRK